VIDPEPASALRHLRIGWWSLLVFLSFGIALESLHGFKVRWYLDVTNDTRRLLLTLAHAHGTVLSLVHVLAGLAASRLRIPRAASSGLTCASVLLPAGFALGGIFAHGDDPGRGILLVPLGALMLFVAILLVARASRG
jgi:hypothetical protein